VEIKTLCRKKSRNKNEDEEKLRFENSIRDNFAKATVYDNGRLVMSEGEILDFEWWKRKIEKAWKDRKKYPKYPRLKNGKKNLD